MRRRRQQPIPVQYAELAIARARKSTFNESGYRRPLLRRLTPLAWISVCVGAFFVALILFALVKTFRPAPVALSLAVRFGQTPAAGVSAAGLQGSGAAEAGAAAPAAAQNPDTKSGAHAGSPAIVQPTKKPSAAKPAASATPRATVTPDSEEVQPGESPDDWAGKMIRQPDGSLLAPAAGVRRTTHDALAFYKALRMLRTPDDAQRAQIKDRENFLGRFFEGGALEQQNNIFTPPGKIALWAQGDMAAQVMNYSEDGMKAEVAIVRRNWVQQTFDQDTLKPWDVSQLPDQNVLWKMRYSKELKRWKTIEILAVNAGALLPTATPVASATPAVTETMAPTEPPPTATPAATRTVAPTAIRRPLPRKPIATRPAATAAPK